MKPKISIIVPCYNEEDTIKSLLNGIYQQTCLKDIFEVIIIDGNSTDNTRIVIENFQKNSPDLKIKVIDNPQRIIPAALNKGIHAAQGDLIIRLDAHSVPYSDYIERCVKGHQINEVENVGGVWDIRPSVDTWVGRGIAKASSHRLGVGDARYRVGGMAQFVETVPFGSFKRTLFDRIGYFNENLLTNEDYEFNQRIIKNGGKILFDPSIKSIYFARKNYLELAKQYWRYGYWKAKMLLENPHTLRFRQSIPPLFVISLFILAVLSLFSQKIFFLFLAEIGLYLIALLLAALPEAIKSKDIGLIFGMPIAMMIMHFCWGLSFVWSLITNYGKSTD